MRCKPTLEACGGLATAPQGDCRAGQHGGRVRVQLEEIGVSAIGILLLFNRYARYKDEYSLEFSIKGELEGEGQNDRQVHRHYLAQHLLTADFSADF